MANLGSIGVDSSQARLGQPQGPPGPANTRIMGELYLFGLSKDAVDGNPSPPCQKVLGPHRRAFLWPVAAGARTISVDVKYSPDNGAGQRPRLVIRANSEVGLAADISTEAPSDAGGTWVTIGPVSVTPSGIGVLEVELQLDPALQTTQVTRWDNVVVT